MKTINDIDVKNKSVVLRLDFNVPVENGEIKDNSKIVKSLRTINYLLQNNCKVVILSHFGRIKSEEDKLKNSLKVVGKELANLLKRDVKFLDNCYGDKVKNIVDNSSLGEVILLENTANANTKAAAGSGWISLIMIAVMVLVFWLFIIRPQKKKQKEEEKMRNDLQIGDEIVTIGGIYGKIVSLKDDSFVLESITDKSKQKFARWAIQQNLTVHDEQK